MTGTSCIGGGAAKCYPHPGKSFSTLLKWFVFLSHFYFSNFIFISFGFIPSSLLLLLGRSASSIVLFVSFQFCFIERGSHIVQADIKFTNGCQVGLELLLIILPLHLKCWNSMHMPLWPVHVVLGIELFKASILATELHSFCISHSQNSFAPLEPLKLSFSHPAYLHPTCLSSFLPASFMSLLKLHYL